MSQIDSSQTSNIKIVLSPSKTHFDLPKSDCLQTTCRYITIRMVFYLNVCLLWSQGIPIIDQKLHRINFRTNYQICYR